MALKRCPECGAMVSSEAEMCPVCAYPFRRRRRERNKTVIIHRSGEGCISQIVNAGCSLIFFVLLLIFGLIFLVSTCFH